MIKWKPKGTRRPIEGVINVSPYGLPKELREGTIIGELIPGRTCVYPFRPVDIPHKIVYFEQDYEVSFLEYEENPWEEFLDVIVSLFEEFKNSIQADLPTPWKAYQLEKKLRSTFTGEIDVTKIKRAGKTLKYGDNPKIFVRFSLQSWGQRNLIKTLWKLSKKELDKLIIFLDNKPIDNIVKHTKNPELLFKNVLWNRPTKQVLAHDLIPELSGNFFTIKVNRKEIPIRDPTKPFDIEIWPLISSTNSSPKIVGFRVTGSHVASFLRYYLLETKRLKLNFEIVARDWKNSKIVVNKITDVPVVRDKELREAYVRFPNEKILNDITLEEVNIPIKRDSIDINKLMRVIPEDIHDFILSFDVKDPEKYSQRYSYIFPIAKKDVDLAVLISRAIKSKVFNVVSKHSIAHVLMSVLSFFEVISAEDEEEPGRIFAEDSEIAKGLIDLVKTVLLRCSCDEACEGCVYNPSCVHENRYIDRILALEALGINALDRTL